MVKQQPTSAEWLSHFPHTSFFIFVLLLIRLCGVLTDLSGHLRWASQECCPFTAELDESFQLRALRRYFDWAIVMATRMSILLFLSPLSTPYSPDASHKLQTRKTLLEILTAKHSAEVRDREGITTVISLSLCLSPSLFPCPSLLCVCVCVFK